MPIIGLICFQKQYVDHWIELSSDDGFKISCGNLENSNTDKTVQSSTHHTVNVSDRSEIRICMMLLRFTTFKQWLHGFAKWKIKISINKWINNVIDNIKNLGFLCASSCFLCSGLQIIVFLSFFFWTLDWLSFFELRILIAPSTMEIRV
jgi:hypothetical protein